ncbi:MAG: SIS domain-containing protein [Paracoccaceae bacterium]
MSKTWATEREIAAQPAIWREWGNSLAHTAPEIRAWIVRRKPDAIWLCGAGTSAFIGDALAIHLDRDGIGNSVRAVPTTDLVARPADFLRPGLRPLVVSFGRSGNSSETRATLDILDRLCPEADRLNITCNKSSALATREGRGPGESRAIILPDACHDQGFAMTSSYTTMLLTALACLSDVPVAEIGPRIQALASAADRLFAAGVDLPRPERAVFLGSGPLLGTARESALKVLELTAGRVVTSWDSTLGFRHGPKAITNAATTVVVYLSSDPLTRKYDDDLVAEIRSQFPGTTVIAVGRPVGDGAAPDIIVDGLGEDAWNTPVCVLVAQLLAVAWSKSLNLNVDDPFGGQNLTRVVANVRIHA